MLNLMMMVCCLLGPGNPLSEIEMNEFSDREASADPQLDSTLSGSGGMLQYMILLAVVSLAIVVGLVVGAAAFL